MPNHASDPNLTIQAPVGNRSKLCSPHELKYTEPNIIKRFMKLPVFFLVPPWRKTRADFWAFIHSNRRTAIVSCGNSSSSSSSMNEDSASIQKQSHLDFDPSKDLFGLEVDLQPRNNVSDTPKPRSWFGPNGQYIREFPCPSCRGRGYTPCTECGVERSRLDCSQCSGKGLMTCQQCLGDCVIWEESIDERPWERARSSSPLKVKEDDEVDKLDIKLDAVRKSKRVYQSPTPEVGLKISRSLRSLNAKTGLFSKLMKIIHRDPTLHAQRVAAIKKTKGTAIARKEASEAMKGFFRNPENRLKRSIAMKGVKFYCGHCREEGHRRFYCPALRDSSGARHKFRCPLLIHFLLSLSLSLSLGSAITARPYCQALKLRQSTIRKELVGFPFDLSQDKEG
ncbi:hypothetical protein MRB53_009890 [Persea americana]|uniref:Uncharacterized protein n=1 Tax=Persea americana TaxID=3435 RepID=A0ACC2LR38_PERAE|nr:hypothetical protein MRB53_009890 [Persea americana]